MNLKFLNIKGGKLDGSGKDPSTIKALVVDDDIIISELIANMLSKIGVKQIFQAYSGKMALKTFLDEDPDIVYLDYVMDDIDGVTVMKVMKILKPDLPVVLFTGYYDRLFKRLIQEDYRPEFILQKPNINLAKVKEAFFASFPNVEKKI